MYCNRRHKRTQSKWQEIPDHPHRILIIGGSGSGKINASLNLINNEPNIDKIYLYAKDSYEKKYQLLINKRESAGLKHLNDSKALIEYLNDINEKYNPNKNTDRKILIVFDDMASDMLSIKKLNLMVTELFIRRKKINIAHIFMTQSYFPVPKNIRLNSTGYFVMKIPNKRELKQIAFNHSSDIDFQDFMNFVLQNHFFFLFNDTTLLSDNLLRFRKNFSETI